MKNRTKNITEVLQNSSLSRLVERANTLNLLNDKLQGLLPAPLRGLCRVANLCDNQLTLETPNAVVRQGILLQQTQLLSRISQDFPQISALHVTINPNFTIR